MLGCPKRRVKHRRGSSFWRNPLLVFCLTFIALGTLRFRARKQGAPPLLGRHRANHSNNQINPMRVVYRNVEQGKIGNNGSEFYKYSAENNVGKPVSFQQWADIMAENPKATTELTTVLQKVPFQAFFFETPPVTKETVALTTFEFVLVDAPRLSSFASQADPTVFAQHLDNCTGAGCSFPSLGGDAELIAPKSTMGSTVSDTIAYAHLANFVRQAPPEQVAELWSMAARALLRSWPQLSVKQPQWFSTSGMGVAWLHFRLDSQPKYYTYAPYKQASVIED